MRISFLGAAGEVTGSCYLVETGRARVLVDFGLFQGGIHAECRNRQTPNIGFDRLDAVVVTHAHIDHVGRLPLLPRLGYRGRIWCTPATAELSEIMLRDSAAVQAMDAERISERRTRSGRAGVGPLYGQEDVVKVLQSLSVVPYDQAAEVANGVTIRMVDAGHILGSASIEMRVRTDGGEKTIAFSGDLGEAGSSLLNDPVPLTQADVVIMESTYGDRDHRARSETLDEFTRVLEVARGDGGSGRVLIPAFAVGRTQQLVYHIGELIRQGRVTARPVYVDSPMALAATDLYRRHRELFDDDAMAILQRGESPLAFQGLRYVQTREESRSLNKARGGAVVIAASGMCTGGRILHHLKHGLWRPETHLIFAGFQGEGTLGRRLVDGAKRVVIMGDAIAVKARIHTLGGFSAHTGRTGLVNWARNFAAVKPRFFLTHGENRPRYALAETLRSQLGYRVECPEYMASSEI